MRAKALLDRKGVTYNEFIIDSDDDSRQAMLKRSGGNSKVPQIFINGRGIGGTEKLEVLDASGQLDLILGEPPRDVRTESPRVTPEEKIESSSSGISGLLSRFRRP